MMLERQDFGRIPRDLCGFRGYGDRESTPDHGSREMSKDMVDVMKELGYQQFR